jgi:hypothetical protein
MIRVGAFGCDVVSIGLGLFDALRLSSQLRQFAVLLRVLLLTHPSQISERATAPYHALHDTVTAPMHSTLRCGRSGCREEYTAAHGLTALAREEQKRFKHIDGYIKLCVE